MKTGIGGFYKSFSVTTIDAFNKPFMTGFAKALKI